MRKMVNITDPAMCTSAFDWDSITLEQFKQAHLWTTGYDALFIVLHLKLRVKPSALYFVTGNSTNVSMIGYCVFH